MNIKYFNCVIKEQILLKCYIYINDGVYKHAETLGNCSIIKNCWLNSQILSNFIKNYAQLNIIQIKHYCCFEYYSVLQNPNNIIFFNSFKTISYLSFSGLGKKFEFYLFFQCLLVCLLHTKYLF